MIELIALGESFMHRTIVRMCLATCLFIHTSKPSWAEELGPMPREVKTTFEVPYKLTETKHVMVRVKLNGKGPFNFILDTGAPALIMSEEIAKKINADLDDKKWGEFKLALEGGVVIPKARGLATDMFQLRGMNAMGVAGVELHGVLGYNILAQFKIQYDFTADKLQWTKLDFEPPKMIGLGRKSEGQGGLEMMGDMMKFLAPLLGMKPEFNSQPRGYFGAVIDEEKDTLVIKSVFPESPAEKSGLKPGDKLLSVKGKSYSSVDRLIKQMNTFPEGEKLKLSIESAGEKKEITLELGKGL